MEKTIKLTKDTSLTLSNNMSWVFAYKTQFGGRDIMEILIPVMGALLELYSGIVEAVGDEGLTMQNLKKIPSEDLQNALLELSGLEITQIIQVIWAMAKAADDETPSPTEWMKQFDVFPLDLILPEVLGMIAQGFISSKNLRRLRQKPEAVKA